MRQSREGERDRGGETFKHPPPPIPPPSACYGAGLFLAAMGSNTVLYCKVSHFCCSTVIAVIAMEARMGARMHMTAIHRQHALMLSITTNEDGN